MRSHHLTTHPLLPFGQSLWFDFEVYRLTLLDPDQRPVQQCALSLEVLTILADLFAAYPTPLACDEQTQMLFGACNDSMKGLHLTIERVSPGSYQLTACLPTQEHPIQHQVSPHPLVYMQLDWRRGLYTIPPFLL